jgi:hypothetical protein
MIRVVTTLLFTAIVTIAASAQGPQLDRAAYLLNAGNPAAAIDILDTLPQTPDALTVRAQAHLLFAAQSGQPARCDHLKKAMDFASMSSAGPVLEAARKGFTDEGCQPRAPTL